jgi:hypothetical protein
MTEKELLTVGAQANANFVTSMKAEHPELNCINSSGLFGLLCRLGSNRKRPG